MRYSDLFFNKFTSVLTSQSSPILPDNNSYNFLYKRQHYLLPESPATTSIHLL